MYWVYGLEFWATVPFRAPAGASRITMAISVRGAVHSDTMLDLTQMASDGGAFRIFQLFYLDEHDATWVPYTGVENSAFTTETAMIWAATETAV